jgi:protein translocase SecG subunit
MQDTLLIAHVVIGILFTVVVLMQDKGVGFGTAVGGAGGGQVFTTKRGAAKILHNISVLLAFAFMATALIYVVLPVEEVDNTAPISTTTSEAIEVAPVVE